MKSRFGFVVAALMASSSLAFASPAQDIFEQAQFYLESQYFGPSTVNMKEHTAKYQPLLDKACADDMANCAYEKAEPVIAQLMFGLEDPHAYYLSAADYAAENANSSGVATSPVPRIGISSFGFCDTPTGACERDNSGNLTSKPIFDRFIASVLPGSPADKAGLKYGDRWVGFNDTLFSNAVDVKAFTAMNAEFTNFVRTKQTVTIKIVRGVTREKIDIPITGEIINTVNFPTLTVRSDGVGVLSIKDWQIKGVAAKIHDLVKQSLDKGVKSIIIDQRNNPGGWPDELWLGIGAFVERPEAMRLTTRYSPEKQGYEEHYADGAYIKTNLKGGELQRVTINNSVLFKGSMAMLVNSSCASACEYFGTFIQRAKRGSVFGEETSGVGNTDSKRYGLINDGVIAMPFHRAFWTDGTPLPSTVKPDVETPNFEFNLFNTGIDQPLQKALESVGAKASATVTSYTLTPLPDFTGSSLMDSVFQKISGNLEMVQQNTANLQ